MGLSHWGSMSAEVIVRLTIHALLMHGPSVIAPTNSMNMLMAQVVPTCNDRNAKCENSNCRHIGHTKERCFWKGGGMEGQYPEWWQKSKTTNSNNNTSSTPATASTSMTPQANSATITTADNAANPRCLVFLTLTQASRKRDVMTYADSGASRHFFIDQGDFVTYGPPDMADMVRVTAERCTFRVLGCEQVQKWVNYGGETIKITLEDTLHASDLSYNLISLGSLVQKGVRIDLGSREAVMHAPDGKPFLCCSMEGSMFIVDLIQPPLAIAARLLNHPVDLETWHQQLVHINEEILHDMMCMGMVTGLSVSRLSTNGCCEDCFMGKQSCRPFDMSHDPEMVPYKHMVFDV